MPPIDADNDNAQFLYNNIGDYTNLCIVVVRHQRDAKSAGSDVHLENSAGDEGLDAADGLPVYTARHLDHECHVGFVQTR